MQSEYSSRTVSKATAPYHGRRAARDVEGRKQYRYHPRWRHVRDDVKYERMLNFGKALPAIRRQVDAAIKLIGLPREKVLALLLQRSQREDAPPARSTKRASGKK